MASKFAVIGGGPIGLYTALLLSKKGEVDVFEKGTWPKDKVCGQGIMPSGVTLLKDIGVKFDSLNSRVFKGIKYIDDYEELIGHFEDYPIGMERSVLSKQLFELCLKNKKIHLKDKTQIKSLVSFYDYEYVYACDGLNSIIRKLSGVERIRSHGLRMGSRMHVDQEPWSDYVEVYWQKGIEAYVTPVSNKRIEIAFLWYKDQFNPSAHLDQKLMETFYELFAKVDKNKINNDFKAYGPFTRYSSVITTNNITFLGDAYYFLDGITGEGISLGLKSAKIMTSTENIHIRKLKVKALYLNYILWVKLALSLSRYPWLRRNLLRVFQNFQRGFDTILRLNDLSIK